MIHVCFGLHDKTGRYSKFTGTAMLSLFENTSADVTVHILHDNTLTQDNREKFIYLAGRYNQRVKFYNVEELCPDKISEMIKLIPYAKTSRLSVAALYRLLIPQIFPADIDKCIYLDSDIIVNLDIKELWQIELDDKLLAAVPETLNNGEVTKSYSLCADGIVKCEDYFNSGVVLINLNRLRREENKITDGLLFRARNPRYQDYCDQNVLNYCFSTQALKLPINFNRFVIFARHYKETTQKGMIYHYVGSSLPGWGMNFDLNDPFSKIWMNYFVKSPWFNIETPINLYETFKNLYQHLQPEAMINLSAAMSGKTRTFILFEKDLDTLLKNFFVKNDEEIILVEKGFPVQKMIGIMNASRNEKIFFLMLPNFPFNILKKAGFVEGKDFFNAYDFLSETQNIAMNAYKFIQSM